MIRKFFIENGNGEKYHLTDSNYKHFLSSPSGLGFSKNITTTRLGNGEVVNSETIAMPQPSGEILFYDKSQNAYQDYFLFMQFIRVKPLKFCYQPPNTLKTYYIDCVITSLTKTEYNKDGMLHCPVTFYGTSFWKDYDERRYTFYNVNEGGTKYYQLQRDYYYPVETLSNMVLNVNGGMDVGFKLEINGDVTNPQLTASQNGVTYGILKLNGSFDKVIVNSEETKEEIYLENNGSAVTNPTSYQDLTVADGVASVTFFKLLVGESVLSFTCSNIQTFDGDVTFTWNDKMVSV